MQRLIYISSTRTVLAADELDSILRVSRRNNAAAGVTGLLVAGGRRFLQVLEGEPAALDTVFQRIQQDPRHHAVVILSRTDITTPSFGAWSMGYAQGGATATAASLPDTVAQLLAPVSDPSVRGYFEGFAQVHKAA
ncbi:BLUF domain-containing protein [Sphingomonas sp. RB3P16]|uniref:BLUF domain-containing protein n=1 Tax=Parasphingomonas frigoris TaxID=3096163 RepID=UPI002FC6A18A